MSEERKFWTYSGMVQKVRDDIDLNEEDPDEQFITTRELIGYFNEAIEIAEKTLGSLHQDYFLTSYDVPLVAGTASYVLPPKLDPGKIRSIMYEVGTTIYEVKQFPIYNKFNKIAFSDAFGVGDDYRYYHTNDSAGNERIIFDPVPVETAIVPPLSNPSTPIKIWYQRKANKIPYVGEYCNPEDILSSSINATTDVITVNPLVAYVTGDRVKFTLPTGSTMPGGLSESTVYYVIYVSATTIKLATSAANASLGSAIDITSQGSGYITMKVAGTQVIIDATIIDIPDFSSFIIESVKANCLAKDGDPRMQLAASKAEAQLKLLQESLAKGQETDSMDILSGDFSIYEEMS